MISQDIIKMIVKDTRSKKSSSSTSSSGPFADPSELRRAASLSSIRKLMSALKTDDAEAFLTAFDEMRENNDYTNTAEDES